MAANCWPAARPCGLQWLINSNRGVDSIDFRKIPILGRCFGQQAEQWYTRSFESHLSVNWGSNFDFAAPCLKYSCFGNLSFTAEIPKECCKRCQMKK
jgi:hypothetical protein